MPIIFNINTILHSILITLPLVSPVRAAADADELTTIRRQAEARAAIAEAERAELVARLPQANSKPLAGNIETKQFGAAGLVKAFDLARELAGELCTALPADPKTTIYEAQAAEGMLAARLVQDAITHQAEDLGRQSRALQQVIETHTPQGTQAGALLLAALTTLPATLRAGADLSALFKSDASAAGIAYGDGARSLFVTALARQCPNKIDGLGSGYLGELDWKQYDGLLARVRGLGTQRAELENRIALVQKLADGAKGDEKKDLAAVAAAGNALLKNVDAFVESLRAGETGERSPLFNAARYLGYALRTRDMLVLDVDLRLEGITTVKDNLFTGQRLRLSGVAFLWYRLHAADGKLLKADTVRRMTPPVEVDLRGEAAAGEFWSGR